MQLITGTPNSLQLRVYVQKIYSNILNSNVAFSIFGFYYSHGKDKKIGPTLDESTGVGEQFLEIKGIKLLQLTISQIQLMAKSLLLNFLIFNHGVGGMS